jgi:hypothetical protein
VRWREKQISFSWNASFLDTPDVPFAEILILLAGAVNIGDRDGAPRKKVFRFLLSRLETRLRIDYPISPPSRDASSGRAAPYMHFLVTEGGTDRRAFRLYS